MSILVLQPTHLDVTICFTNVLLIKASCSSRIHFSLAEIYCCLFFFFQRESVDGKFLESLYI